MTTQNFDLAIAVTHDYALMACGFLAKLRFFHPRNDLYIITDEASKINAEEIACAFNAKNVVVTNHMGFECLEWGAIVTSKFRVFDLPTTRPVVFLDIDQILNAPLDGFVDRYIHSGVVIAGGQDDKPMHRQFQDGKLPAGLNPTETAIINTGAFIATPDKGFYKKILDAIPSYSGLIKLPTQGLINGLLYLDKIPFDVYGDDFMVGPFSPALLNRQNQPALIHLWTPRPAFVVPNPPRKGINGEITWENCVASFECANQAPYPVFELKRMYMEQMRLFEQRYSHILPNVDRPEAHRFHYTEIFNNDAQQDVMRLTPSERQRLTKLDFGFAM